MSKAKNKGEWSELYVFAKILSDRNLVGADQDLNPIYGENYPVLKILRNSKNVVRTYDLSKSQSVDVVVKVKGAVTEKHTITNDVLESAIPKILEAIQGGKGAFKMLDGMEFAEKFSAGDIKTAASKKGDIEIIVYDKVTSLPSSVEFSIKSYLGALPTLLNSSQLTNFTYKVKSFSGSLDDINDIDTPSKIKDRTKAIINSGASLEYLEVEAKNFLSNLRKIDTIMPQILSEYILAFNTSKISSVSDLTKFLYEEKKIDKHAGYEVSFEELKYKMKQFFLNVALGMVPKHEWDGFIKADGGYIIVKETGDVVCFHIYNISQLGEYLFDNTKLQNYGTTKSKFGKIYEQNGNKFFKLNLNVRFAKPRKLPNTV